MIDQFKATQMTKETSANVLKLINFFNKILVENNGIKMFYYGPTIQGLTTSNII